MVPKTWMKRRFTFTNFNMCPARPVNKKLEINRHSRLMMSLSTVDVMMPLVPYMAKLFCLKPNELSTSFNH